MTDLANGENKSSIPTESQVVENAKLLISQNEAEKLVNVNGQDYDILSLLTSFESEFYKKIKKHETKDLRQLTDAKNIILRIKVEEMVATNGRFDFTNLIPFETACTGCKGTGELYKFFRHTIPVDCKFCDKDENGKTTGKKTVICRSCKGSGKYQNNFACRTCKDPETNQSTGKVVIKCRKCRGSGTFHKLAIDSKLKSTTHCRPCKGRGFIQPEKEVKKSTKPANPVLPKDLGEKIKASVIREKDLPDHQEIFENEQAVLEELDGDIEISEAEPDSPEDLNENIDISEIESDSPEDLDEKV